MNVIIPVEHFNKHYVFFEKSVKNIVLENSDFIKIIYSNELCVLNNLYLSFDLYTTHYEDNFKKRKYYFVKYNNQLKNIIEIEKTLLKLVNINDLQPCFNIKENIESGCINCVKTTTTTLHYERREILLKISGIWVTKTNYGITYKFFDIA